MVQQINNKGRKNVTTRRNEKSYSLGSKETPYIFEYSPQVLESFDNRHA